MKASIHFTGCVLAASLGISLCGLSAEPVVTCELSSEKTTYKVGENPKLSVRMVNQSSDEILLVGSLDGSDGRRAFPKCWFEVLDSAGNRVLNREPVCGNMGPLQTTDFVVVAAGAEFKPCGEGFFPPQEYHRFPVSKAGTYTVRFHYSTLVKNDEEYWGDRLLTGKPDNVPEIQRLLGRVAKMELKSNKLKLTFTGYSDAAASASQELLQKMLPHPSPKLSLDSGR